MTAEMILDIVLASIVGAMQLFRLFGVPHLAHQEVPKRAALFCCRHLRPRSFDVRWGFPACGWIHLPEWRDGWDGVVVFRNGFLPASGLWICSLDLLLRLP